jgi:hypothetical protein
MCGLCNDAISSSGCTGSNDQLMNDELEGIWKEVVVA